MYDTAPAHPELDRSTTAILANFFELSRGPLAAGFGFTPWLLAEPGAAPRARRWSWLRADAASPWAFAAIVEAVRTHG
ncbi:hypothetical protein AB0H76_28625 [Nocardia sp. NPDC050712]|uniref:hypothetical protein n=1 Tax=Nocardia sp. NPDC050712 TaxID=3155518 RepID=UPI00340AAA6A